ncbi:hypothetical protein BKA82DRAFT_4011204 [Pisolithus tinctorius]|nr:hypothetical protein BKA82DRAFT_4011204 [Pisolithus tinctorius]
MDEPEDANPEVSNGHIDKPNTIGTCGQPIVDTTEGDLLLSEPNIETVDLEINSTNLEDHRKEVSTRANSSTTGEIALPCPREVQVTPSNQGTLTDKQRWLKPLQEGERDRAQATQHEICNSQHTWKVPSDGTGSLGVEFRPKDANGERHSGGSGNATGGSAIRSHGIEKTKNVRGKTECSQTDSPVPPEPPSDLIVHICIPYRTRRRRGKIKANPTKRQQSSHEQKRAPYIQYTLATTRITLWMLSPPLGFPLNVANTYSPQRKRVGDRDDEDEAEAMPWEGWGGGESTLPGGTVYVSVALRNPASCALGTRMDAQRTHRSPRRVPSLDV